MAKLPAVCMEDTRRVRKALPSDVAASMLMERTRDLIDDPARLAALAESGLLDSPAERGFDDIVSLATRLCAAPIALVSFVAADRQWFKARINFPDCETDLDRSVCQYVLDEPDLLVIPDLSADPRTAENPLVTGEAGIRFYAGAPLRTRTGLVLGSLCVIDTRPRPQGLLPEQAEDLRALGRQVTELIALRRASAAERTAQAAAVADAARLEAMIATQQVVASAVDDLDTVFQAVVDGALSVIDAAAGAVIELREGDELVYRAMSGTSARHAGCRMSIETTASGRALLDARPVHCPDTLADEAEHGLARALGIRSLVAVPLYRQGVAIGVLKVQSDRPDVFTPRDILMAQMLAGVVTSGFGEVAEAKTRRALRDAESRYKAIFDSAIDFAIVAADAQGRITDWNAGAAQIMGWSAAEIRDRPLAAFFTPEDCASGVPEREMRSALSDGTALDERWHVRKDGERFWATGRMMALRHEDGAPRGYLKILQDRTSQRDVEIELRASEERLRLSDARARLAQEAGRIGTFEVDVATGVMTVSPEFCRLFGLPVAAQYPAGVFEGLILPEDAERRSDPETRADGSAAPDVEYRIRRADDGRLRWIARRAEFARDAGGRVASMFGTGQDITDRRRLQEHQTALIDLGDRLRGTATTAEVVVVASEVLGRTLEVSRAGFAHVDLRGGRLIVERDWTAPDVASLAGEHDLALFRATIDRVAGGETLTVANVPAFAPLDPDAAAYGAIGTRAQIKVPMVENDDLVGLLYAHQTQTRTWTPDEVLFAHGVADLTYAALAKVRAEAGQRLLNEELSHRLKNTLTMVLSIAAQSLRPVPERGPVEAFEQRVRALASAHDVLLQGSYAGAPVGEIVRKVLHGAGQQGERFDMAGPEIVFGARAALSLSLLLHELTTNAAKYGALSNEGGRVSLTWRVEDGADPEMILDWVERDGPPVHQPERRGFGSRIIRMGLVGTGGVDLAYPSSGLVAAMRASLAEVRRS